MISCDSAIELASRCQRAITLVIVLLCAVGCHSGALRDGRSSISGHVAGRFGVGIGDQESTGDALIPPDVVLEDGVSEDEAVQTALWNNAVFQETLTQLGISHAQLLDAGLIADPQFQVFFPLGPKQLEFTTFQAIDALWLRPVRVRAAELDVDRVTHSMVQNGLDLIRDTRVAHANLVAANEQAEVAREAAALRRQIADLAQKRLDVGDISELEFTTSRIDALQAKAAADRVLHDVTVARERLRTVMGIGMYRDELTVESESKPRGTSRGIDELVDEAFATRPDLRAAEIAIEVSVERAGLARQQFMNLDAIYDANGSGSKGFESGLGLRFTIPIFNRNQDGIAIADAQWEQAVRQYVTVRDRVTLDVRTAHTQLAQANENLTALRQEILPALREAEELARRNYENGGTPYFFVLQTTGQYLDARVRESQLLADQRRAVAELDRSVGHRVCDAAKVALAPQAPAAESASLSTDGSRSTEEPTTSTDDQTDVPATQPPATTVAESITRIPLQISVDPNGHVDAVVPASHLTSDDTQRPETPQSERKKKMRRRNGKAEAGRWKNTRQDAEHVQVTIDIRLDPRLVPAGVQTAEGGLREEDGTSED